MKRIREVSAEGSARIAGGFYIFTLLAAQWIESLFPGRFDFGIGILTIVGMSVVTISLYRVFKPVSGRLSLLAAFCNFTGMGLEAIRLNSHGSEIAMVFHGFFCLVIGYLILKSHLVPRILGLLIALAGLAWVSYLTPSLANDLSPFNVIFGLLGETSVFLWLLGTGINAGRLKQLVGDANDFVPATKRPSLKNSEPAPAQP